MRIINYVTQITESIDTLKQLEAENKNPRLLKRMQFLRLLKDVRFRLLTQKCQAVGIRAT